MVKIKYELSSKDMGICLTECPFNQVFKAINGVERIRKVGSIGCHECKYFQTDNKEEQFVECNKDKQ